MLAGHVLVIRRVFPLEYRRDRIRAAQNRLVSLGSYAFRVAAPERRSATDRLRQGSG